MCSYSQPSLSFISCLCLRGILHVVLASLSCLVLAGDALARDCGGSTSNMVIVRGSEDSACTACKEGLGCPGLFCVAKHQKCDGAIENILHCSALCRPWIQLNEEGFGVDELSTIDMLEVLQAAPVD